MKNHDFFSEVDWGEVGERRNEPPMREILEKHDIIKFRDPTGEEYMRKRVARKQHSDPREDKYELKLFEFRTSN